MSTLTDSDIQPLETQASGVAAELNIFSRLSAVFFIKVARNGIITLEWPSDLPASGYR